ncbi:MAG: ATP-binding cassette domain-containing protein, partial [Alphaproteobacteria bacterium]
GLGLGYVPQGREIFPFLTVLENLRMATRAESEVASVLEEFPVLKPLLARQGGSLSGGQQQILAIARCMCTRPKTILLDEPTEGIQPSIVEEIAALLARLRETRGLALVVVEQRLEFIAGLASRALVMQKGRVVREIQAGGLHDRTAIEEIVGMGA